MSKISFVILHYGDEAVTKRCLQSIWKLETKDELSVVLIDNDGVEGFEKKNKQERMQQLLESIDDGTGSVKVSLLSMPQGYGFSKANNEGYGFANAHYDPDYIIIANNDVIFSQKDILMRMENSFEKWDWEVLGPDIIGNDGASHQNPIGNKGRSILQLNYTILANTMGLKMFDFLCPIIEWNYQRMEVLKAKRGNSAIRKCKTNEILENSMLMMQSDIVPCGACIILSRKFLDKEEQVFVPETQFYYEEYILYERCKRKNYKIIYDPSLKVIHGEGIATKAKTQNQEGKLKFVMQHIINSAKVYRSLLKNK